MAENDFHIEIDLLRHESSLEDLQDDGSEGGMSVAIMRYHRALERERLEREHAKTVELLHKAQRAYHKWFAESIQHTVTEEGDPHVENEPEKTKEDEPEPVPQPKPHSSKSRPQPKEHAIDDLEGYSDDVELLLQAKEHSKQYFSPCSAESIPSCTSLLKEDSFLERFYKKKGLNVAKEGQTPVHHASKMLQSKCIQTDEEAESSNFSVCSSSSVKSNSEIRTKDNSQFDVRKPAERRKISYSSFQKLIREVTVPRNVTSVAIQAKAEVSNQSTQTENTREERQGGTFPYILSATDAPSDYLRYIMAAQTFYNPQILQQIYGNNLQAYSLASAPLPVMPSLYYPGADRSSLETSISLEHTRLRDPGSLLHGSADPCIRNVPPLEPASQDEDRVQGSRSVIYCAPSKGGLFQKDMNADNRFLDNRKEAEPQVTVSNPESTLSSAVELCAKRVLNLSSGYQRADGSRDNSPNGNISLQVNLSDTNLSKTPDLTHASVELSLDVVQEEVESQVESISDKDIRIPCIYHDLSTIEEADSELTNSYSHASNHLESSRKYDLLNPKVAEPHRIDSFRDIVADFETFEESKKRSDQAVESELRRLSAEAKHSSEKLNKVDAREAVFKDKVDGAKNNLECPKSKKHRTKASQSQILDTQLSASISKSTKGRLDDQNAVRQQKFHKHLLDSTSARTSDKILADVAKSSNDLHDNGSEAVGVSLNGSTETSARSARSKNILIDEANKMMQETSPEITLSIGTSSSFGSYAPLTIITIPQRQENNMSFGEKHSHKNSQVSNNSSVGFQPLTLRISPHTSDSSFSKLSPRYSIIPKLSPSQDRVVSLSLQSSDEQSCCIRGLSSESGTKSSSSTESFKPLPPVFYSGTSCCGFEEDNDQAKRSSSDESFRHLKRSSKVPSENAADSPATSSFASNPPVPSEAAVAKKSLHITTSEESLSVVFSGLKGLHQSTPIRCSSESSEKSSVPDSLSLLRSRSETSIKPACSSTSSGSLSDRTVVHETDNEGSTEGREVRVTKSMESLLHHELISQSISEGDG